MPDSSYVLAGWTNSDNGDVIGSSRSDGDESDFWTVKLAKDNVLPIKILDFAATQQSKAIMLSWLATADINTNYFSVQKRNNEVNFNEIGKIDAHVSASAINYSFIDDEILTTNVYYRVKEVDKDGKFSYSSVISLRPISAISLRVSPNPAKNILKVIVPAGIGKTSVQVVNANGSVVINSPAYNTAGNNNIALDISGLANGLYAVKVLSNNGCNTIKFLKQ